MKFLRKCLFIYLFILLFLFSGCEFSTSNGNNTKPELLTLDTPSIELNDNLVSWTDIENATEYWVYVNNQYVDTVETTNYTLDYTETGTYKVSVRAVGNKEKYKNSATSNTLEYVVEVETLGNVNIFAINDTHGSFNTDDTPGMEKVASVISSLENLNGAYVKIANGDVFQGSYVSNVLEGLPFIDAFNTLEFDAFVIGNHEFDWGIETIGKYKDGDLENGEANFPFLGANIIDKKTQKAIDWLEPYTIIQNNGRKVGVIGVIGEKLESSIAADKIAGYEFVDPLPIIKNLSKELRVDKDCDVVIVSIHEYYEGTLSEIAKLTGNEAIDAIICGHTHSRINEYIKRVDSYMIPIIQSNTKNITVGEIILEFENNSIISSNIKHYQPSAYGVDTTLLNIINKYKTTISEGNRLIGYTNNTLQYEDLGTMAVEGMANKFNSDIAIMNTGGVRSAIYSGDIALKNVYESFPFNNEIIQTKILGSELKKLLDAHGSYFYYYMKIDYSSIQNNHEYSATIIDYVFDGTYYKDILSHCERNKTGIYIRDIVIEEIENKY